MSNQAVSTLFRAGLRSFVRSHPGSGPHLNGRKVNDLSMSDLRQIVTALGGDPDKIQQHLTVHPVNPPSHETQEPENKSQNQSQGTDETLATIRDLIVNGGFTAADQTLRTLIENANKPAEVIEVPASSGTAGQAAITHAKPTNVDAPWSKLFGVRGDLGKRTSRLWDGAHPDTPRKDDSYVWPQPVTGIALSQLSRGENIFLWGPPGTGKTAWAMQFAANTGRPFALISCDDQTDAPTLLGMTVPKDGGTVWQDGALTKAVQTPGCVVCIDEPSVARAGALMVMQNVLAYRTLYIAETGRRVRVASQVVFICCDNTNGTGGGARHGYVGTGRLNDAFLDRFGAFCHVSYLPPDKEADVIVKRVGCTRELAELLIGAATTTRQAAETGALVNGISLRRLFAWAALLSDGVKPRDAFNAAIYHRAPEQDREALTQQCLLTYDQAAVTRALNPQAVTPENTNQTAEGRAAAEDFSND